MPRKKAPELTFQEHIADFLIREHKYGVLEQTDITDTEHFIAEIQLWAFLKATQGDTLKKLANDYGTDAQDEVFRALRNELAHTPLWMLLRHGLKVRGLEFRLYYPKPRSSESAAVSKYAENRITFRPHFYFGEANQEIDFVFFLNGLLIVQRSRQIHQEEADMFKRIDHVEITSGDLERSIRFYKEVFGFALKERMKPTSPGIEEIAFLTLGDTMLELLAITNAAPPQKSPQVGFRAMAIEVDDMDRAIEYLKGKGIELFRGPVTIGRSKRAEIKDPDGLSIELRQW